MVAKTRAAREVELLNKLQTESGRAELLKKLKFQLGIQPDQSLPPGTSLIGELLDAEFGTPAKPR
jgi:hypothetical protein